MAGEVNAGAVAAGYWSTGRHPGGVDNEQMGPPEDAGDEREPVARGGVAVLELVHLDAPVGAAQGRRDRTECLRESDRVQLVVASARLRCECGRDLRPDAVEERTGAVVKKAGDAGAHASGVGQDRVHERQLPGPAGPRAIAGESECPVVGERGDELGVGRQRAAAAGDQGGPDPLLVVDLIPVGQFLLEGRPGVAGSSVSALDVRHR